MLEGVLAGCPASSKVDGTGSPAPFARELAVYLAHCSKEGRLTVVIMEESSQFGRFFCALNNVLMQCRIDEQVCMGDLAGSGADGGGAEGAGQADGDDVFFEAYASGMELACVRDACDDD